MYQTSEKEENSGMDLAALELNLYILNIRTHLIILYDDLLCS